MSWINSMKLFDYAKRQTSQYVMMNLIVSIIGFFRSFIFMRWLGLEELGLISLAQTVMQFISLFQFGLINGGYRLFSLNKLDDQRNVNNTLFTFFTFLLGVFLIGWSVIVVSGNRLLMNNDLLFVAIMCGILMLINNWLNNTLIGKQKLSEINIINLVSCILSLAALFTIPLLGFWGAVFAVCLQPFCFVTMTLLRNADLRPTGFLIDTKLIKYILSFGFIPFLAGLFIILNLQIERWSIASVLGNEALGRFYLVFLYNSLYLLIPNSIQNIFFPRAVISYDRGEFYNFKSIIKQYSIVTFLYNIVIIIATLLLFDCIVSSVFPLHAENTVYVFLLIPGLIAVSFEGVVGLILNATVRLKPMFFGSILGLFANIMSIYMMIKLNTMSLERMAILKAIIYAIPFVTNVIYVLYRWNNIRLQCTKINT